MLKTLLSKQMREMATLFVTNAKSGKRRSRGTLILYALLMVYVVAVFGFLFFTISDALCKPLVSAGLSWLYFALMAVLSTTLGVVGSVFMTHSAIYQAKDNELLLSLPIPPSKILFVRMSGCYLIALVFEALVMIPAYISYFQTVPPSAAQVLIGIIILFMLPFIALTISLILGFLIAIVWSHVKNRSFVTVALSLGFIAAYYYVYSQAYGYLQLILMNSELVGNTVKTALYPIYCLGIATQGGIFELLIFTVITAALFGLVYYILSRSFIKLVTTKHASAKKKYIKNSSVSKSIGSALMRRELMRFKSSPVYMLNCSLGTVMLVVLAVAGLINAGFVTSLQEQFAPFAAYIPLIACAAVCFLVAMNDITAPSVSLEGKNLWLIRSLPTPTWEILKAKLKLHIIVTLIPLAFCSVCISVLTKADIFTAVLSFAFQCLFAVLGAQSGLMINLKFPKLDWTNETVAVKQGASVILAMLVSWATVFVLCGAFLLLKDIVSATAFLILCTAVLLLAVILCNKWLKSRGTVVFEALV